MFKFRKFSGNSKNFLEVQGTSGKVKELQKSSRNSGEGSGKIREVQGTLGMFKELQRNSESFREV